LSSFHTQYNIVLTFNLIVGFLAFYEICNDATLMANQQVDLYHQAPYSHHNKLWVGYDDLDAIYRKVSHLFSFYCSSPHAHSHPIIIHEPPKAYLNK